LGYGDVGCYNADDADARLYDLQSDPSETKKLLESQPQITAEMKATLRESIASGRSVKTRLAKAFQAVQSVR
jgi:hypothetical protein